MITSIVVAALTASARPATGPRGPNDPPGAGGRSAGRQPADRGPGARPREEPAEVLAAMGRDLGLTPQVVRDQAALQARALELDRALRASLGDAFAGSAYEAGTGRLTVMVSDAGRLAEVRAAGAEGRLVKHSAAHLEGIVAQLNAAAGTGRAGTAGGRREASGVDAADLRGVTSWHVDPRTNRVRVSVAWGRGPAVARALAPFGDAVTVEESGLEPTTTG